MAQVLLHGTNFVNFMGRYVYVGCGKAGFDAVQYITPVSLIDDNESRVTRGGVSLRGAGQEYQNYITTAIPTAGRLRDHPPGPRGPFG